jgi:hypothetical protein
MVGLVLEVPYFALEFLVLVLELAVLAHEFLVLALELGVLEFKSLLLVLERGEVAHVILEITGDEFICVLSAIILNLARLASVGIIASGCVLGRNLSFHALTAAAAAAAVSVSVSIMFVASLELIHVLPAIRLGILRAGTHGSHVVVMVVVTVIANLEFIFK